MCPRGQRVPRVPASSGPFLSSRPDLSQQRHCPPHAPSWLSCCPCRPPSLCGGHAEVPVAENRLWAPEPGPGAAGLSRGASSRSGLATRRGSALRPLLGLPGTDTKGGPRGTEQRQGPSPDGSIWKETVMSAARVCRDIPRPRPEDGWMRSSRAQVSEPRCPVPELSALSQAAPPFVPAFHRGLGFLSPVMAVLPSCFAS